MFEHYSVLKNETIESLNVNPEGIYVDCTLGGGGHSEVIASALTGEGRLICFDQDEIALEAAKERLKPYEEHITFVHANFRQLKEKLQELGLTEVDGIIYDLGVSSPQLDVEERGFSYHQDAPLDMRMNQDSDLSAWEVINEWAYEDLVRIFFKYGEEKFSKQIARKIEAAREIKPIETTGELVELVKEGIPAPARRKGGHPASGFFRPSGSLSMMSWVLFRTVFNKPPKWLLSEEELPSSPSIPLRTGYVSRPSRNGAPTHHFQKIFQ